MNDTTASVKTKRQQRRDERAHAKKLRALHRAERETFRHRKAAQRPDRPGPRGERWTPVPETDFECNQFGHIRRRVAP